MYEDIRLYPSTRWMHGTITHEQEVEEIAHAIYDDLIIGRRLLPEDVPKLLKIAIRLRDEAVRMKRS